MPIVATLGNKAGGSQVPGQAELQDLKAEVREGEMAC